MRHSPFYGESDQPPPGDRMTNQEYVLPVPGRTDGTGVASSAEESTSHLPAPPRGTGQDTAEMDSDLAERDSGNLRSVPGVSTLVSVNTAVETVSRYFPRHDAASSLPAR